MEKEQKESFVPYFLQSPTQKSIIEKSPVPVCRQIRKARKTCRLSFAYPWGAPESFWPLSNTWKAASSASEILPLVV